MLRFVLVCALFWSIVNAQNATDFENLKLEFVQTLWRHGDRSALYELYPIFKANWTLGGGGLGELTPLGMAQMNDLGVLLRKRYVEEQEFLSQRYVAKEIYVRSTNYNRTVISAMSLLYGLYPPGIWNIQGVDYPNSVNWQQGFTFIPLHIDAPEICITTQTCSCARNNEIQKKWAELPEVQAARVKMVAMNRRMAALFNITENQDSFNAYAEAWKSQRIWFNDTLYKELPFYNEQLYREAMTTIAPFKRFVDGKFVNSSVVNGIDISHETRVIQSGQLLNELFERAQLKADCIKAGKNCTSFIEPIKFYGYSSHDLVLYGLLVTLNLTDFVKALDGWPDTGAALTFELYSNSANEFFVKFLYRDNAEDDFDDVTSQICNRDQFCSLEDFEKIAESFKPLPDLDTLCATSLSGGSAVFTCWISFSVLVFVVLMK